MVQLHDFPDFLVLPMIYWDDVTSITSTIVELYHVDYYDGPLEGMIQYDNQKYWYKCIDESHNGSSRQRLFILYEPTHEQIAEHDYWHNKFENAKTISRETLDGFYEEYKDVKFIKFTGDQARYLMYENVWELGY